MKSYKTKDKAYYAISEEEEMYERDHFCPLIGKNCNSSCICFKHPTVQRKGKEPKPWVVSRILGCTNKMFGE